MKNCRRCNAEAWRQAYPQKDIVFWPKPSGVLSTSVLVWSLLLLASVSKGCLVSSMDGGGLSSPVVWFLVETVEEGGREGGREGDGGGLTEERRKC